MTKEEKIKEAYGNYYHEKIDENGWSQPHFINKGNYDKELFNLSDKGDDFLSPTLIIRPKSLQGIENNNGWIKIESEVDLPNKDKTMFHVAKDKRVFNSPVNQGTVLKWWYSNKITHYQPITKPESHLY